MTSHHDDLIAIDAVAPAEVCELDSRRRREKIYTRRIEGRYQRIRLYTGWPLLMGYLILPWVSMNERPVILFDLADRKFHIFNLTLWPQDLVLLGFLLIIAAFALFAVTTIWGRLWCGYTCPQTIWTAIFMYIEQRFEGSRNQRIKLDMEPPSWTKLRKKTLKHAGWLLVALVTGITFVGYFVPIRSLIPDLLTLSATNGAMAFTLLFSAATYLNAGYMREKVCTQLCPYARFQSVMFDQNTLVVAYDTHRGEPRGSRKRFAQRGEHQGDCIDCELCVQVCPTGIDIRNGLQYECIGCALCIDACDSIMAKMGSPKGLVSYSSGEGSSRRRSPVISPKALGYATAFVVMMTVFAGTLLTRNIVELTASRDRSQLYVPAPGELVDNIYELHITNRDHSTHRFEIGVQGLDHGSIIGNTTVTVPGGEMLEVDLRYRANPRLLRDVGTDIEFTVVMEGNSAVQAVAPSRFIRPSIN